MSGAGSTRSLVRRALVKNAPGARAILEHKMPRAAPPPLVSLINCLERQAPSLYSDVARAGLELRGAARGAVLEALGAVVRLRAVLAGVVAAGREALAAGLAGAGVVLVVQLGRGPSQSIAGSPSSAPAQVSVASQPPVPVLVVVPPPTPVVAPPVPVAPPPLPLPPDPVVLVDPVDSLEQAPSAQRANAARVNVNSLVLMVSYSFQRSFRDSKRIGAR